MFTFVHRWWIDAIYDQLNTIIERMDDMQAAMERLTREVQETRTVNDGILALLAGVAQQIRDNVANAAALNKLADDLDAEQARIAGAVTANTPAEGGGGDGEPTPTEPVVDGEPFPPEQPGDAGGSTSAKRRSRG